MHTNTSPLEDIPRIQPRETGPGLMETHHSGRHYRGLAAVSLERKREDRGLIDFCEGMHSPSRYRLFDKGRFPPLSLPPRRG
jgi:hypothetical protein